MDKVLHEATQLLNDYNPKEALIKLSGFQNPSEQSFRLKEECKKLLRQQLLYLLKEANETNDYNEMERLLKDYKRFLKADKFYKSYHEKILQKRIEEKELEEKALEEKALEEQKRKQEEIDRNFNRAMLILFFFSAIIVLLLIIESL